MKCNDPIEHPAVTVEWLVEANSCPLCNTRRLMRKGFDEVAKIRASLSESEGIRAELESRLGPLMDRVHGLAERILSLEGAKR